MRPSNRRFASRIGARMGGRAREENCCVLSLTSGFAPLVMTSADDTSRCPVPVGSSACDPEALFGDALDLHGRAGVQEAFGDPVGVGAAGEVRERKLQAQADEFKLS